MTKRKWDSRKLRPDARERARRENERQRALKKNAKEAETDYVRRGEARAEVNRLLSGSYTAEGIQQWWQRRRPQLGGRTPEEVWASAPGQVVALARALTSELGT